MRHIIVAAVLLLSGQASALERKWADGSAAILGSTPTLGGLSVVGPSTFSGSITVKNVPLEATGASGNIISASSITTTGGVFGNGSALTGTTAMTVPSGKLSGIVDSAVLPSTVAYTNRDNNWSATQTFAASATITGAGGLAITDPAGRAAASAVVSVGSSTTPGTMLFIQSDGKVGVGTSAPTDNLSIGYAQAGNARARFGRASADLLLIGTDSDVDTVLYNLANGYMRFGTNNTERIRILAGGNVGVNTDVPSTTLDVNGAAQFGSGATKSTFSATGMLSFVATGGISTQMVVIGSVTAVAGQALTDPDVAHGMTDFMPTDQYGRFGPLSGTIGGLDIVGMDDTGGAGDAGLLLRGYHGATDPTDTAPAVQFRAGKKSGNDIGALGALETAYQFTDYNTGNAWLNILGSGNVGIGNVSPATKLHLSSGTLTIDGNVGPQANFTGTVSGSGVGIPSLTTAQVQASTPSRAGVLLYNSDLSVVCVSTGTTIQGYAKIDGATTCQ